MSVQDDFLERQTKAEPVQALAELIWNSLDADATRVTVELHHQDLAGGLSIVEFDGSTQLNQADHGENSVLVNIAFRANLKTVAGIQPRLGLGFVFPMTEAARAETHWGIYTSLVFEY